MVLLYYALGGGLGHVVRAVSVARQVSRQAATGTRGPIRQRILVNTPFQRSARQLVADLPGAELVSLCSHSSPDDARRFVRQQLSSSEPACLVVDTFPRGLGGEWPAVFAHWDCVPRVLISRQLPTDYVERFDLFAFVCRHYDRVLVPGESSPFERLPNAVRLDPFLIRSANERLAVGEMRRLLRLKGEPTCVLFVGTGTPEECRATADLARCVLATWSSELPPIRLAWPIDVPIPFPADWIVHTLPLIDVLPLVGVVVGNAGYNLAHEAQALRVPAVLIARQRLYDDQSLRASLQDGNTDLTAIRELILEQLTAPRAPETAWSNGAESAAQRVLELVG